MEAALFAVGTLTWFGAVAAGILWQRRSPRAATERRVEELDDVTRPFPALTVEES